MDVLMSAKLLHFHLHPGTADNHQRRSIVQRYPLTQNRMLAHTAPVWNVFGQRALLCRAGDDRHHHTGA